MMDNNSYIDKQVGNYHVLKQISARGAFGSVYQGKHIVFIDRPPVAIKLLHKHLVSEKEQQRFLREARLLEMLKHDYILPIIDAGIENESGVPYLVALYAYNGSLRDRIQKQSPKPLAIEEAVTILSQIGQALHYAHQRNIVHRDLKPDNILFNAEGQALLADFGIAVVLEEAITQSADPVGTPAYMAPEQFEGKISKKSDQYALACIAYELLTGRRPFSIPQDIQIQWFAWKNQHTNIIPSPPTQINPNIPKHMEQAILKAMEKQHDNRHASIIRFLDALGISLPHGNVSISQIDVLSIPLPKEHDLARVGASNVFEKTLMQWLDEGFALFEIEHYEEALTIYEKAIRLDSKSAEAYYRIGQVLEQLGQERLWEALAAYNQAIYLDPKFTNAYIGKGNIHCVFQRYEEALEDYQEAIRVSPKLALGYYKIGNVLTELERYKEALSAYESAILNDPNSIDTYYQKIRLLEHFERYDEALTTYDQIVELAPNFIVNVYFKKADLLRSLGRYDEALTTYDQIIQFAPDSIDVYYQKINLLEHLKRHDAALVTYDKIIKRNPNSINIYYEKINLLEHLGRYDEALTTYDQIILVAPNPMDVYSKKIKLLEHLGRHNDILETYDKIIQRSPVSIDIYYQKIKLLKRLERYERALVTYDQVIRRTPNPINVYYEKIKLLEDLGRYDDILETYDQIIERSPNSINVYYEKIKLLEHLEHNDDILETYDQIIDLDPHSADAYFKKATLLEKLGEYEKALETYNESTQMIPSTHHAYAYYRKGKVLERRGKTSKWFFRFREESVPNFLSPFIARLIPNPYYEEALIAYITAYELSSNIPPYSTSIGDVLKSLGKINEARKLDTGHLSWSARASEIFWLSVFNVFNALCISILLGILFWSWWVWGGLILAGSLLSGLFMYLVKRMDQPYNLFNGFILFLPSFLFGLGWAYASMLLDRSIPLSVTIFLLCFLGIAFVSFLIDIFGIEVFKKTAVSIAFFLKEMFRILIKLLSFLGERFF